MQIVRSLRALIFGLATSLGMTAQAAVLYSQGPVPGGVSIDSTFSLADDFGTQNADSYLLPGPSSVTAFRWWGTDAADADRFVVRRFDTLTSTAPPALAGTLTSAPVVGLLDSGGLQIFQYDFALATALALNGSGFLSVFYDIDPQAAMWYWIEGTGGDGGSYFRGAELSNWDGPAAPDLAFAVIGEQLLSVPEPSSIALLAIAAFFSVRTARRRAARY